MPYTPTAISSSKQSNDYVPGYDQEVSTTVYGGKFSAVHRNKYEISEEEMPARTAAKLVRDELLMDCTPAKNLATFVSTYMEDEAEKLMLENLPKNVVEVGEYPACAELERRCVNMIARLFNVPLDHPDQTTLGVATGGSSEAIILAVLSAKRRWQKMRRAAGKSTERPNIVMSSAVQVCWIKAARYLEVEERYVYCTPDRFVIDPKEAIDLVDENTILVGALLGTTYTGEYEDIAALNDLLLKKNKEEGLSCHIHVDAASGGFVVPFVNPKIIWDFTLPLVGSINVSGHKYGLAYPGVGWALWRDKSYLPDECIFTVNYLGAPQQTFNLTFSKSGIQVIGHYYQLLRCGKQGYRAIMNNLTAIADHLAESILKIGDGDKFVLMSRTHGEGLPLVAWRLKKKENYDEFAIAKHLKTRGWMVPAYTMAAKLSHVKMMRVVVREDFSRHRCETLVQDIQDAVNFLEQAAPNSLQHLNQTKPVAAAIETVKA
jgi:glutamate decarboxylase